MSKPFLQYPGGKRRSLKYFIQHVPAFNNYYEPFLGGGAMFFRMFELYNRGEHLFYISDIDERLIAVYQYLSVSDKTTCLIIDMLKELMAQHSKENYYKIRDNFPRAISTTRHVAEYLYLNCTSFGGYLRTNKQGNINIPISHPKLKINRGLSSRREQVIRNVNYVLANKSVFISTQGYEQIEPRAGDLVYADPPYFGRTNLYSGQSFEKEKANMELKERLEAWRKRGVYIMLSNSNDPFIRQLYSTWRQIEIPIVHTVGHQNSRAVKELLLWSY